MPAPITMKSNCRTPAIPAVLAVLAKPVADLAPTIAGSRALVQAFSAICAPARASIFRETARGGPPETGTLRIRDDSFPHTTLPLHILCERPFFPGTGMRDLWRRPLNRSWFVPIYSALSRTTRAGSPADQGLHERPSGRSGEEPPKKEGHIGRRSKIP